MLSVVAKEVTCVRYERRITDQSLSLCGESIQVKNDTKKVLWVLV